jgi:predicted metalloprotease with PDZ domain
LDSSIDTWVDGYVKGTPGRKVSIYNEGALLAFLTDVFVLQSSNGEKSMDDVMLALIANHNINGVGYTLDDYWNTVQSVAGLEISHLRHLASTPSEYTSEVMAALEWIGQKWALTENESQRFELISNSNPLNNKLCGLYRCPQL